MIVKRDEKMIVNSNIGQGGGSHDLLQHLPLEIEENHLTGLRQERVLSE